MHCTGICIKCSVQTVKVGRLNSSVLSSRKFSLVTLSCVVCIVFLKLQIVGARFKLEHTSMLTQRIEKVIS